jgi:hypothetical protein
MPWAMEGRSHHPRNNRGLGGDRPYALFTLSRKTLAASCTNCRIVFSFSLAGPSSATDFVFRIYGLFFADLNYATWLSKSYNIDHATE